MLNGELAVRLQRVQDSEAALLLLSEIDDPVLKHEDGGPSMSEWAEFNREAHSLIDKHLGMPAARQALLLVKQKEQGFAECWACRMLDHYTPADELGPDPRWVGVA